MGHGLKTLHIAPGYSAAGSLKLALREAGRDDEILTWPDDLSCGPIDPDTPSIRASWWGPDWDIERLLSAFWDRVMTTEDRLVVWFGRHSASELAFFLAWADRMGTKSYDIIDVTGLTFPHRQGGGSPGMTPPAQAVFIINADGLKSLLGSERKIIESEAIATAQNWQRLKAENAPFRVVTENGLVSAPIDHFDPLLLEQSTTEWRKVAYVIGMTLGQNSSPIINSAISCFLSGSLHSSKTGN